MSCTLAWARGEAIRSRATAGPPRRGEHGGGASRGVGQGIAGARPGAGRRDGNRHPGAPPRRFRFRRRSLRRLQRAAGADTSRPDPRDLRELPPGGRRHPQDEYVRRHTARPRRIRPGGGRTGAESDRRGPGPRDGRCVLDAGSAQVRRRVDGTDDEGDLGHGRRDVRGAHRALRRAGPRPARGRSGLLPGRDLPGHAQRESCPPRGRAGTGRHCASGPHSGRRFAHHRADGNDARRPVRGGGPDLAGARGSALSRSQLLDLAGLHERPLAVSLAVRAHARGLRAERGASGRAGQIPGSAGRLCLHGGAIREGGMAEPGGRLLRNDAGAHRRPVGDDTRPLVVGERTNVLGSKKFRDLIKEERYEEAAEIARAQVKRGAHVIDVSTQQTDRDEVADMSRLLERMVRMVRAPLMIDSTNERAIEAGLILCQGKAVINSINLEDGEKRFANVVPLAKRYGAALVVGCIDERGQAIRAEQKLAVALRSHDLLTRKYGIPEEDLYFDPLVFPCASGDANYTGSALDTIEAVRLLKQRLPRCKTVLGISNVSFGLPPAGREVVNSVFLYHCVQAGLDLAIVNAEKLERYPSIPEKERGLAEDVLFVRGEGPTADERMRSATAAFTAHFRERNPRAPAAEKLGLDERLARYVVEGTKDGLVDDLDEKLKTARPLDIINGPLMRGMDEVGRLFNDNQLIVAEVLQSAEAMKAAVNHLQRFMDKASCATRGKVILATVKGDVHDIGKNLVEIVLSNNGFEVVNLGIKVPPERLIEAVREHRPDIVGLSGLLVKSAHQMVATATDLKAAGIDVPLLVGGAALSRNFVASSIAPAHGGMVIYARDAMAGLDLAKKLVDEEGRAQLREQLSQRPVARSTGAAVARIPERASGARSVARVAELPQAPDWNRHVLLGMPLDQIWRFVNPVMLYGKHLGLKSSLVRDLDSTPESELLLSEPGRKAVELRGHVESVKSWCKDRGLLRPKAVYQFFRAAPDGDAVVVQDRAGGAATRFDFPRQPEPGRLCLSDYVAPEADEKMKHAGEYLRSHILQALALETAEAFAELLHTELRRQWGFPDPLDMPMSDRFKARYRGKRYSFGYPACPRLEDQAPLFQLLRPESIGVQLTDGFMMDPEASVSALVLHHPAATYFSVAEKLASCAS